MNYSTSDLMKMRKNTIALLAEIDSQLGEASQAGAEPEWPYSETPEFREWPEHPHGRKRYQYYSLDMIDEGESLQDIELTREEFIAVKNFIGTRRGLVKAEQATAELINVAQVRDDLDVLKTANREEAEILACALSSYREDRGCDTPVERFVYEVLTYNRIGTLTPEMAARLADEFKDSLERVTWTVQHYAAKHPELFPAQPQAKLQLAA